MGRTRLQAILAAGLLAWLVGALVTAVVAGLVVAGPSAVAAAGPGPGALEQRRASWPAWRLHAPLPRPGRGALEYPAWFVGDWQVSSWKADATPQSAVRWTVRFRPGPSGAVVGDRAANARAVGQAVLGDALQEVRDDPANPNRQLARLRGDQTLESTVVGRRSEQPPGEPGRFLSDELTLQVLHGPGDPRVSRIETLSRYERHGEGEHRWIAADQWQARYPSPAQGLVVGATGTSHWQLRLDPLPPGSDPAS
ncbi:MAG: DUF6816 family protein [Cyanobium sp.]